MNDLFLGIRGSCWGSVGLLGVPWALFGDRWGSSAPSTIWSGFGDRGPPKTMRATTTETASMTPTCRPLSYGTHVGKCFLVAGTDNGKMLWQRHKQRQRHIQI
jgi:hypothetical protein